MQAVVMAGGEGTRLRPLTCQRPKPLVPILNKPIMEYILQLLMRHNLRDILVTLYYLADEIESYFGNGSELGINIVYSVEDTPLGTAGSVKKVEDDITDTFLIISGDALCDFDLSAAINFHKEKSAIATLVLKQVENPLEYGVVETFDDGKIKRFLEKPSWGEVFSDTVNTGIYILNPKIFEYMEKDKQVDFSKDLFPLLLEKGEPLFGYVADGYWCDIGNLQQYRQAHFDLLLKKVNLQLPAKEIKVGIYVGENTEIDNSVELSPPVFIGNNVRLKKGVKIRELTIIGDNCIIEPEVVVSYSIINNNVYVGSRCQISGSIIAPQTVLKPNVSVAEGAVIGDKCQIGVGSNVKPQIKIWPEKIVEPGATVSMSLIWGIKWPGSLFAELGVKGLANREITPDFATKLGAAFGASLERQAKVITSRDTHPASRMIKRALIAGLMSVGANVRDLRLLPLPVTRHEIKTIGAQGGVHVRLAPDETQQILIQFFDCRGVNLAKNRERKIENIFFREDFRRTDLDEIGSLEFSARAIEYFSQDFLKFVNSKIISAADFKMVIDYGYGSLSLIFPTILGKLKCETVALNSHVDATKSYRTSKELEEALKQLSTIVTTLKADIGTIFDVDAERMVLVDEKGRTIENELLLAIFTKLILEENPGCYLAFPLNVPNIIEKEACENNAYVIYTKADATSLMFTCDQRKEIIFAGDLRGGFIFPQFQPAFNAMIAYAKLLELLAIKNTTLGSIVDLIPPIYLSQRLAPCPWEHKGRVMRKLISETKEEKIELLDGLKIHHGTSWILIRPDTAEPYFHIYAEGSSKEEAESFTNNYYQRILELQD